MTGSLNLTGREKMNLWNHLLGRTSGELSDRINEKIFMEDAYIEAAVQMQRDIVMDYTAGELYPADHQAFEENILNNQEIKSLWERKTLLSIEKTEVQEIGLNDPYLEVADEEGKRLSDFHLGKLQKDDEDKVLAEYFFGTSEQRRGSREAFEAALDNLVKGYAYNALSEEDTKTVGALIENGGDKMQQTYELYRALHENPEISAQFREVREELGDKTRKLMSEGPRKPPSWDKE